MRRAIRDVWPALAERFHVLPWHFDGGRPVLAFGEIDALWRYVEQERVDREVAEWRKTLPGG